MGVGSPTSRPHTTEPLGSCPVGRRFLAPDLAGNLGELPSPAWPANTWHSLAQVQMRPSEKRTFSCSWVTSHARGSSSGTWWMCGHSTVPHTLAGTGLLRGTGTLGLALLPPHPG